MESSHLEIIEDSKALHRRWIEELTVFVKSRNQFEYWVDDLEEEKCYTSNAATLTEAQDEIFELIKSDLFG
jgi:hypothetical protein